MQPTMNDIQRMAFQAGEILRAGFGQTHAIRHKGVIDLVTEIDQQAEEFLLGEIEKQFPEHRVFSEETGGRVGGADNVWYVDPIDGTVNYAHGLPIFCVSIAYAEAGDLKFGAVFNPVMDEFYTAERGRGAWLNGEPIRVAKAEELVDSLLVTGFPYDAWTNPVNNMADFERFSKRSQGVRRLGSAALDLAYVAAGRLDGYWEIKLNAWDVAAGALIVQEAGGRVSNVQGGEDFLHAPQSILAANPALHGKMLELLGGSGDEIENPS